MAGVKGRTGRFAVDITSQRFGRWLVLDRAPNDKRRKAMWRCVCDCGEIAVVCGNALRSGQSKSCGCYWMERFSEWNNKRKISPEDKRKNQRVIKDRWAKKNIDAVRAKHKRDIENLSNHYVAGVIRGDSALRIKDIPMQVIETKRLQLKIYRLLKDRQDEKHD